MYVWLQGNEGNVRKPRVLRAKKHSFPPYRCANNPNCTETGEMYGKGHAIHVRERIARKRGNGYLLTGLLEPTA